MANLDDLLPTHVAAPAEQARVWSPYQLACFDAQEASPDNLLIEAVAGGAKTTTLVELSRRAGRKNLQLAFNRNIADELRSRVGYNTEVRTLNSLGHMILMRKRPGAKLNQWKSLNWLRANMSQELFDAAGSTVARAISLAKANAVGIVFSPSENLFSAMIEDIAFDLDLDLVPALARITMRAFLELTSEANEFDFDDQLWVPIANNWTFPAYDTVYVDEAQDLNTIQHIMLRELQKRGARIVAVGDRRQAIYGWRGALSNSMDELKQQFSMEELPLSVTYRCALAITNLAQTIVPQITARDGAPAGELNYLEDYPKIDSYTNNDLIVCRNNAPIFGLALEFIKERRRCRVFSTFMEEVEKFINGFKTETSQELLTKLDKWISVKRQKIHDPMQLVALEDRYEVVSSFAREFKTTREILWQIRQLATSTSGPRISTIHRAKGTESDRVFFLRPDLIPNPKCTTEEQLIQEENLSYVAITRAKLSLNYLPGWLS
jgi:hypothetical protein